MTKLDPRFCKVSARLLPALAGMGLGQWIRLRVQPVLFKRLFFSGLLLLGAYLSLRSLMATMHG